MKTFQVATALGLAQLASLAFAAQPPFPDAYDRLCSDGQTSGSFENEETGVKFNYFCDTAQSVGHNNWVRTRSAEVCADICDSYSGTCDVAIWDKSTGNCWRGQPDGDRYESLGQILIVKDQDSACQEELAKYKPVAPNCDNPDTREVTEIDGQKYFLACRIRLGKVMSSSTKHGVQDSLEACLKSANGAKGVVWNRSDKKCYSANNNVLAGDNTYNNNIDSAVKMQA